MEVIPGRGSVGWGDRDRNTGSCRHAFSIFSHVLLSGWGAHLRRAHTDVRQPRGRDLPQLADGGAADLSPKPCLEGAALIAVETPRTNEEVKRSGRELTPWWTDQPLMLSAVVLLELRGGSSPLLLPSGMSVTTSKPESLNIILASPSLKAYYI